MKNRLMIAAMVSMGMAAPARAQNQPGDAWYFTAQIDSAASLLGGGGEAEWLHPVSPRSSVIVGGASASLSDLWWSYGTIGGMTRHERFIAMGRASVGAARYLENGFTYSRWLGNVTVPLGRSVFAESELQHARILGAGTTVVKIGGIYTGIRRLSLRAAYNSSASPGRRTGSTTMRADLDSRRMTVFGGVTATRASSSIATPAFELLTHASREVFGGVSVNGTRSRVITAVQIVPSEPNRFVRVTSTLHIPLNRRQVRSAEQPQ